MRIEEVQCVHGDWLTCTICTNDELELAEAIDDLARRIVQDADRDYIFGFRSWL